MVRIAPLVLFGLVWHFVCSAQIVNKDFLPSPLAVGAAFVDLFSGGEIARNLSITLFRAAVGLLLGVGCGVWIGMMMARSRRFREYVTQLSAALTHCRSLRLFPCSLCGLALET